MTSKLAVGLALFVSACLALAFLTRRDDGLRDEGRQAIRDSLGAVTALRLHRKIDAIGERVVGQSTTVTRTVHRLDTLWKQLPESLITRTDTVKVLDALPAIRAASDSSAHACMELVVTCAELRVASDSLVRANLAVMADRDQWRRKAQHQSSRFATVLRWTERAGLVCLGMSIANRRLCWQ